MPRFCLVWMISNGQYSFLGQSILSCVFLHIILSHCFLVLAARNKNVFFHLFCVSKSMANIIYKCGSTNIKRKTKKKNHLQHRQYIIIWFFKNYVNTKFYYVLSPMLPIDTSRPKRQLTTFWVWCKMKILVPYITFMQKCIRKCIKIYMHEVSVHWFKTL